MAKLIYTTVPKTSAVYGWSTVGVYDNGQVEIKSIQWIRREDAIAEAKFWAKIANVEYKEYQDAT